MDDISLTDHELIKFLKNENQDPLLERGSNLVYISLSTDKETPLFFIIRNGGELLQMITYLPYKIHDNSLNEISRFLHLLNRDLDMPGFALDEAQGLIFYRAVIPCLHKKISRELLRIYINTFKIVSDSFGNAIGMIATGHMTIKDLHNLSNNQSAS